MPSGTVDAATVAEVFTEHYGRAVASLIRVFGDVEIAEDAVQDAFTAAVRRWPADGLPPSPPGWIITTARHRAVDRLRREAARADKTDAASAADTDWPQILELYNQLAALSPGPMVTLNRAVALAEVCGPATALAELDTLDLEDHHLYHAVRADLLRCLGRAPEAAEAYRAAIALSRNTTERHFLTTRADSL